MVRFPEPVLFPGLVGFVVPSRVGGTIIRILELVETMRYYLWDKRIFNILAFFIGIFEMP